MSLFWKSILHTVLVVGGYGFFGARICEALSKVPGIRVQIRGRSLERAQQLADRLSLGRDQAVSIDASGSSLPSAFSEYRAGTVIYTAGPFQGQDWPVASKSSLMAMQLPVPRRSSHRV